VAEGGLIDLGVLGGNKVDQSVAFGLSDKGLVIGASINPFYWTSKPFIWTQKIGIQPLQKILARAGAVISGDTTRETKPHPAPLLAGAAALAILPEQCVYVGDAERDIIAGRAARMHTLFAAYGYVGADETPATWNADGELDALPELLDWLPLADIAAAQD